MSESSSEALRLLREARRYLDCHIPELAQQLRVKIDALLVRAEKDNAAGQVTGNSSLNSSSMENRLDLPAPAAPSDDALPIHEHPAIKDAQKVLATAPAEAPMLTTDAVIGTIRFVAVKTGISATTVGAICHDVRSIVGDLERRFHAALERERKTKLEYVHALREVNDRWIKVNIALADEREEAQEKERLANMRADQAEEAREAECELASATQALLEAAEEARDAAQSTSVALEWTPRADIIERQVAWIDRDACHVAVVVKGQEYLLTLPPLPAAPVASTSEREGNDG